MRSQLSLKGGHMLDKEFLRGFFNQVDSLSGWALMEKITLLEKTRPLFVKGSEAHSDAGFLLKHLRREVLERQFKPQVPA